MSGIENLGLATYADTLSFRLMAKKIFCMKMSLILPNFHEKALTLSRDI